MFNAAESPRFIAEISSFFKRSSSRKSWEISRSLALNSGIFPLLGRERHELEEAGNYKPQVWENSKKSGSHMLVLVWDDDSSLVSVYGKCGNPPFARGVRIISSKMGELKIEYTKDEGWEAVEIQRGYGSVGQSLHQAVLNAEPVNIRQTPLLSRNSKPLLYS